MGEEESSTVKPTVKQAIASISSLISLSHSIKIFPWKWNSIRNKLDDLLSNLSAIDNCEISSETVPLATAIESMLSTLKNCNDLANHCLDFSFGGKLRTQSDLDILSAKLDIHMTSISDIYFAGLLTQRHAIVVSRPSASSSKEDLGFYINDLLSRFKIGGSDEKKKALTAFNEAISETDRYAKIAVEIDGFVNFLMKFLNQFGDCEIQREAAMAAASIASFESCRGALIAAGIIGPLIRVLELGMNQAGKEFAARCLMKVTENSQNAWAVSAHGGVTALLKIIGSNAECGCDLVSSACGVLKNLVGVEEIRRFTVEDGAIPVIVEVVRSSIDETILICSIDLLQSLVYGDESLAKMAIEEGGICALLCILDPKMMVTMKAREAAFRGISSICISCEDSIGVLLHSAFIDHVLYFLQYGEFPIQELALKAAFWLCGASKEAKKDMGGAGFMPVLVKFLDSKIYEVRELAAKTLSGMMVVAKNRKQFVESDQNVGMLLRMLDPNEGNAGNKNVLVSILMALASSHSGRKKIVSSEHLKNIERLAETKVSDAEKVVRKLSCNRFRSMLNGLWLFFS